MASTSDPKRYTSMPAGRRWRHVLRLALLLALLVVLYRLWSAYLVPRFPAGLPLTPPPLA